MRIRAYLQIRVFPYVRAFAAEDFVVISLQEFALFDDQLFALNDNLAVVNGKLFIKSIIALRIKKAPLDGALWSFLAKSC